MWETFALLQFFDQPLYILKRELTWIPFFGWYLIKSNMIGVDPRRRRPLAAGHGAPRRRGSAARPPVDHFSGGHADRRSMRRRTTRPASPRSMSIAACPACRWRSIRGCSGRAAPSCAIPARWWSNFSIRCRRACRATNSSRASATAIEDATNRLVEAGRREQAQLFGRVPSAASAKV